MKKQPDRHTREAHVRKLCERLTEQVRRFTPDSVFLDQYDPGDAVEFAHRRFLGECRMYEDGRATQEQLLAAAYALRDAWREKMQAETEAEPQRAA